MNLYNYDTHLAVEDEQLFSHRPKSWRAKSLLAARDVIGDIRGYGHLDSPLATIVDDFARAEVEISITASSWGDVNLPASSRLLAFDPDEDISIDCWSLPELIAFETVEEISVTAGETSTVVARAALPGSPHNVDAGWVRVVESGARNIASISNEAPATGGVDHQLTRASVLRTMAMVMFDLMREIDDAFDAKRRIYMMLYKEEIERLVGGGLRIDFNSDGELSDAEEQSGRASFQGFIRG